MTHKYGSKEFYAEQFADFIADCQHDSPEYSDNLVAGFLLAIDDWRKYHVKQILELDRVEYNFHDQSRVQTETP
jgi:hypothetical protein